MILKEALENAIGESIASDGAEVQITVPDIVAAIDYLQRGRPGGIDSKTRTPDGWEVSGSEDSVSWALLIKGKP